mgnify:CR=1 FL=1
MIDPKPVVLVVEDQNWVKTRLERELGGRIDFHMTSSPQEAQTQFKKTPKPKVVVINARLQMPVSDSVELAEEFKGPFTGIMIGTSGTPYYQDMLEKAGCDYVCDQDSLIPMLIQILNLQPKD